MIKFDEFLKVNFPNATKVKFNMNEGDVTVAAWDLLKEDDNTEAYQRWLNMNAFKTKQANNNLNHADYLLAFAQYYPLGPQYYIFGGMYKVEKKIPEVFNDVGYNLTLMNDFQEYRRRLVIKLKKPIGRDVYNKRFNSVQADLEPEIYEILPNKAIEDFPGYNNVLLTHKQLQYIFKNEAPEWKRQLSSVKGVYCITDTSNGQLYIGSAYGDYAGIWQRWAAYANVKNLTGGNKAFEELKGMGTNYIIDNFTYSILEILDSRTSDIDVIARENHWKNVFKSKKYGMNKN